MAMLLETNAVWCLCAGWNDLYFSLLGEGHRRPKGQWLHLSADPSLFELTAVQGEPLSSDDLNHGRANGRSITNQSVETSMYLNFCGGREGEGVWLQMWDNPPETHSQWILESPEDKVELHAIKSASSPFDRVSLLRHADWLCRLSSCNIYV
jgi:hypothetical protein